MIEFKDIIKSKEFIESKYNIPVCIGKDTENNIIVADISTMPHLLIAGQTGSGKSVCVNSIISSMIQKKPKDLMLILVDPKVVELQPYNKIPHLKQPVITEPQDAFAALQYVIYEMERRFILLSNANVRDISEYKKKNQNVELPYIIIVIDEFMDLMMMSKKETEKLICRIAAKARAVGIHLILATQRPSVDVITGLIKANIPARIAFKVTSIVDSRIILDQKGAEKLNGKGDMLYLNGFEPVRIQGCYISTDEVDTITNEIKGNYVYENNEETNKDPLFEDVLSIVKQFPIADVSYIQRRFGIGHKRALDLLRYIKKELEK